MDNYFIEINGVIDGYLEKSRKEKRRFFRVVQLVIVVFSVCVVFCFFGVAKISSETMIPTYTEGQIIIFNKFTKDFNKGDIVLINYQDEFFIRRIIGTNKDVINIDNETGKVKINSQIEKDDYQKGITLSDPLGIKFPLKVAKDKFFVLCDNRKIITDSRKFGCISKKNIVGKVMFCF